MSGASPRRTLFAAVVPSFVAVAFFTITACRKATSWSDNSALESGFVTANGIRLHYLD